MRIYDCSLTYLCRFTNEQYTATCGFVIVVMRAYVDSQMNNLRQHADLQV